MIRFTRQFIMCVMCVMAATTALLVSSHRTDAADGPAENAPVKVYILSGQSNMVGIGQVGPMGMTRHNTFVSPEPNAEEGVTLSIYAGAYDASIDYNAVEPVETHRVRLGYWPHTEFPDIDGPSTSIARGFIRVPRSGQYSFRSTRDSMIELSGKIIYRQEGQEPASIDERITLDPGTHPIQVTFFGTGRSNLSHNIWDVPGALYTLVNTHGEFPYLIDEAGNWASRDDVWYTGVVTATANKWLSIGCGAGDSQIGPELGFGHMIANHHDEPVLIIKASQGNRSLGWDFLPPGSERFEHNGYIYAGYRDPKSRWEVGTEPAEGSWYAGKQYDDCVEATHEVLNNFDKRFPHWAGRGYEIAGFVWWQGHKDGGDQAHAMRYEQNLVQLIHSLRNEFQAPDAPFVVATIGFEGWKMDGHFLTIANAQLAVSGEAGKYPQFKGNVTTVETRDFWPDPEQSPRNQNFHYHQNAGTYMRVGESMGNAMVELLTRDSTRASQ